MKFELVDEFAFSVEELESIMFHEDMVSRMKQGVPMLLDARLLNMERQGDVLTRRVLYQPSPVIKKVGTMEVEPQWMEWIEESTYNFSSHKGSFKNIPARKRIAEVFDNHGTIRLEKTDKGCRRIVCGDLFVKVFLLGKVAERIIYPHAKELLSQEAALLRKIHSGG